MTQPAPVTPKPRVALSSLVRRGRQQSAIRLLIHGIPKVGKSTCASGAPSPIFLPLDNGVEQLDVDKLPKPRDWDHAMELVNAVVDEPGEYKTLVIDPVNYLEALCWAEVCKRNGWKDIEAPGYGKGYNAAVDLWRALLAALERGWQKGLNIIIVAHSAAMNFKNPEGPDYARYTPALHEKAAGLLTGWVDAILFARTESGARAAEQKGGKAKGYSTSMRVFHTTWAAAWEAGNRWSLAETIPLGWVELAAAIQDAERSADEMRTEIAALAEQLGPEAVAKAKQYVNSAGSRVEQLREVLNAIQVKIQAKEENK